MLFGAKCLVPQNLGSFQIADTVAAKESVEVGAVDVDFAADLGEGDEALVAVVLPRLGGDAKELAPNVIYPRLREVIQVVIRDFGK